MTSREGPGEQDSNRHDRRERRVLMWAVGGASVIAALGAVAGGRMDAHLADKKSACAAVVAEHNGGDPELRPGIK